VIHSRVGESLTDYEEYSMCLFTVLSVGVSLGMFLGALNLGRLFLALVEHLGETKSSRYQQRDVHASVQSP
jgi:hypothetical protein